jgi:hypothetical protein
VPQEKRRGLHQIFNHLKRDGAAFVAARTAGHHRPKNSSPIINPEMLVNGRSPYQTVCCGSNIDLKVSSGRWMESEGSLNLVRQHSMKILLLNQHLLIS